MRGNSLSFFKPPVFGKTVLIFCALFSALLFNSCKQLASFDPGVEGARIVVNNTLSAPTGIVATHGLKRKISLQWIPVSGATYYDIYCADSATAEFKKIGETVKNSFDDNVSAGKTLYYKVCAVKSRGTQSSFSVITKGTSLAQPIISGGEADDSSVTISWFMENARGIDGIDNYEDMLKFEVCYQPKSGGEERAEVIAATDFFGSSYEYTFTNLAGSSEYQFYVKAYLFSDQQSFEQSSKVDKETLTSYVPLAPEFIASQGESAKGIWLFITLPEKVMVSTVTKTSPEEKTDEPYPLCFEISRKSEGGNYEKVETLYYNGTTTPPNATDYLDSEKGYVAGTEIRWFDESANVQGGVKYTYRIRSFVDVGYSTVVCPEGNEYDVVVGTPEDKASESEGWKSAHPVFKVTYPEGGGKTIAGDPPKVCLVEFGFHAEWNDLGVADKYKFAMKQNRKLLGADSSASGTDTWLTNKNDGSCFFTTLDEINEYAVAFGSKENGLSEDDKGIYSYTLYIIPKSETAVTDDESIVFDSTKAIDEIQVTPDAELPEAELTVKDGYKDKVVLTVAIEKPGEKYKVVRTRLENGRPIEDSRSEFVLNIPDAANVEKGTFVYDDTDVQSNCTYSYILKAEATGGSYSSSLSQEAETLGTPTVSFEREKLSYDSVTISFGGVLAAEKYVVQLGAAGSFGDGETFAITKDEYGEWKTGENAVTGSQGASADVTFSANKFTVTVKKPHGYDDATLAGIAADATVTAHSAVDNATSAAVAVNVVGPALLDAKVSDDITEDSISLSWNRVDGAKGYLIRRVMYDNAGMENVAEDSEITYYCDASGKVALADGGAVGDRVTVEQLDEGAFRLTDNYKEKNTTDPDLGIYEEAQAKISWGLPFRYVVLPVLDKKDFEFESRSLKLAEDGKVAYKELKETEASSTLGYGLNLVAAKAESGTYQAISWEAPYKPRLPVVYRRAAGSGGAFAKFSDNRNMEGKTAASMQITDSRYDAFEYIVKYCQAYPDGSSIELPPSLLAEISTHAQDYDTPQGAKRELDNKGYLLTVGGFNAQRHPEAPYCEQLYWTEWDYTKRAVGPDSMTILIQNNNIDGDYHELASVSGTNAHLGITVSGDDVAAEAEQANFIRVAPKGIAEGAKGTTEGPLKVLRDYRHSYILKLNRTIGEDPISVLYSDYEQDGEKIAWRDITDEELVKATMLILADIVKDSGMESHTTGTGTAGVGAWERAIDGATGYVDWWQNSGSRFRWRMKDYQHKWSEKPSDNLTNAFITLSDDYNDKNKGEKSAGSLNYLYNSDNSSLLNIGGSNKFDSSRLIPIYVIGNSGLPASYSGTVEFSAKKQYLNVKLSRNGSTTFSKTIEGTDANYWCPINLDGNGYLGQNSDYGWWPSSN